MPEDHPTEDTETSVAVHPDGLPNQVDEQQPTIGEEQSTPQLADPEYPIDLALLFEAVERKSMGKLADFGGIAGVAKLLNSDTEKGIDPASAAKRADVFGTNMLNKKEPVTFWPFLKEAFQDQIIIMLSVSAVLSMIFGLTLPNPHSGETEPEVGWIEGFAIIISIAVVTLMGSINNYQKAKKFEEMEKEQSVSEVQVFRGGEEITIKSSEIVVGDVLLVEGGVQLSVDGLYLTGNDLKANESAMTGEPDVIKKNAEEDPFFLSGTQLEEGDGRMMVIGVGMNSYQGKMKEATDEEVAETPLQEHLGALADDIGKIGFIGAFVLVAALFIKEGILIGQGEKDATATAFLNYIIVAITIIVVAIPEGLPLAVTISLAFSMKSMMHDNCLVRVLSSCETMGAATAICSDKTGTLTTNRMTVVQGYVCGEEFVVDGYGVIPRNDQVNTFDRGAPTLRLPAKELDYFCAAVALNSTAREQIIDGVNTWVGNKTEHGLLGFCNMVNRDYKQIRSDVPETNIRQFPFNSRKKRMDTIWKHQKDGSITILVKGASEIVLQECTRMRSADGSSVELSADEKLRLGEIITNMADQGNRTIAIASCPSTQEFDMTNVPADDEIDLSGLTFLGVLGIQDPIRQEVPQAVLNCMSAGITVRMVTGDNIHTAMAIGKKCNIYDDNGWDKAMTGEEFREMHRTQKTELLELVPRLRVLARSSPADKHILVGLLQEIGEVVGVTGDGTNDAPALRLANVGFAMAIGTDIARAASEMVLLDNNFASVVNAVKWGRAVNDNIRKFLQYQLSINLAGCILTIIGALASHTSKEPFAAVQLLWLNLIMDTMAALALATERPDDSSLARNPVFKQAPLISNRMWGFILIHGSFQTILILVMLFTGHDWLDTIEEKDDCDYDFGVVPGPNATFIEHPMRTYCNDLCTDEGGVLHGRQCQQGRVHSTIIFNTFIWFQIFNIFNARKLHGEINPLEGLLSRSQLLMMVFVAIVCFQVFAVEVGDKFLKTQGLAWNYWLICVGLGFIEIPLGLIVRLLPIHDPVPDEIQKKWDHENRLRESLGVAVEGKHRQEKHERTFVRKDTSLRRQSTMTRSQRK